MEATAMTGPDALGATGSGPDPAGPAGRRVLPPSRPRPGLPRATLADLILATAARRGPAVAVRQWDGGAQLRRAGRPGRALAATLRGHGVGPESRVGICAERRPDLLVAVLGVLLSGGATCRWTGPTRTGGSGRSPRTPGCGSRWSTRPAGRRWRSWTCRWSTSPPSRSTGRPVRRRPPSGAARPARRGQRRVRALHLGVDRPAEGRRGQPPQRRRARDGVRARTAAPTRAAGPSDSPPLGFDASVQDLFIPLVAGGEIALVPDADRVDPARLQRFAEAHGVTWGCLPAALLPLLDPDRLPHWRTVFTGIEAPAPEQVARWAGPADRRPLALQRLRPHRGHGLRDRLPGARSLDRPVPMGRPLANHRILLVDADVRPVPAGDAGRGADRRRRPGSRLSRPAGPDRGAVRPRPVLRRAGRPALPHRRPGGLAAGRATAVPRPDRPAGQGPRPAGGARRGRGGAGRAPGRSGRRAVVAGRRSGRHRTGRRRGADAVAAGRRAGRVPPAAGAGRDGAPGGAPAGRSSRSPRPASATRRGSPNSPRPASPCRPAAGQRAAAAGPPGPTACRPPGSTTAASPRDARGTGGGRDLAPGARHPDRGPGRRLLRRRRHLAVGDAAGRRAPRRAAPGRLRGGHLRRPYARRPRPSGWPPRSRLTEPELVPGQPPTLSPSQRRLWFLDQLAPDSARLQHRDGGAAARPVDLPALRRALRAVADRHEVLRWRISRVAGAPHVALRPAGDVRCPSSTCPAWTGPTAEAALRAGCRPARRPGSTWPPGRCGGPSCTGWPPDEHVLALTFHHAVFDGWSQAVLVRPSWPPPTGRPGTARRRWARRAATYADYAVVAGRPGPAARPGRPGAGGPRTWPGRRPCWSCPPTGPARPRRPTAASSPARRSPPGLDARVRALAARLGATPSHRPAGRLRRGAAPTHRPARPRGGRRRRRSPAGGRRGPRRVLRGHRAGAAAPRRRSSFTDQVWPAGRSCSTCWPTRTRRWSGSSRSCPCHGTRPAPAGPGAVQRVQLRRAGTGPAGPGRRAGAGRPAGLAVRPDPLPGRAGRRAGARRGLEPGPVRRHPDHRPARRLSGAARLAHRLARRPADSVPAPAALAGAGRARSRSTAPAPARPGPGRSGGRCRPGHPDRPERGTGGPGVAGDVARRPGECHRQLLRPWRALDRHGGGAGFRLAEAKFPGIFCEN